MALSTNSIFHFTKTFGVLNKILEGEFKIFYCKEEFSLGAARYGMAIPMVSFCDIPLSQVTEHINSYGSYGVGLSKQWAIRKSLNPVMYMEQNSFSSHLIEPAIKNALENDEYGSIYVKYSVKKIAKGKTKVDNVYTDERRLRIEALIGQLSFMKNYSGDLNRSGKSYKNYRFYDEREWRFVPWEGDYEGFSIKEYKPILALKEYDDWKKSIKTKPSITQLSLEFSANDIEYIIVKKENQISRLINKLKKKKKLFSSEDELNLLFSKIISTEKIKSDF